MMCCVKIIDGARVIAMAAVLAIGLMMTGCGKKSEKPNTPPEVVVVVMKHQSIQMTTELPGRTSAYLNAEVRPQVGGIIQKRLFTEGADVKAGEVLYQIDPAMYQAAYDSAKAALARAEANVVPARFKAERYKELIDIKAVSQQEYDEIVATYKQAEADVVANKAAVETARINLAYTRVVAPISGRIGRSSVTDGALVTAQQPTPLATIQEMDPMYVDVPQSTADLLRLRTRLKEGSLDQSGASQRNVRLILEDGSTYPLTGTLQFRDVTVDPTTGSVILRVVFRNPKGVLLPGMFVRTVVQEGINKKAILVPQQAVARDPTGNPFTMIVDAANKVQVRPLALDRAISDQWLISSGLAEGERVIVEGVQKVTPGAAVTVVPSEAGKEKNTGDPMKTKPSSTKVN